VTSLPAACVAVVGPLPPIKGGIALYTRTLLEQLDHYGVDAVAETWAAQYPKRLYPGDQYAPETSTQLPPTVPVRRSLRWFDPIGWVRCGFRSRRRTHVILTLVVPVQAIPLLVIGWVARLASGGPEVVVIAHNVLPHESGWGDRFLVARLLRSADRLVVHSPTEVSVASGLASVETSQVSLPPFPPTEKRADRRGEQPRKILLFFGLIRPYKGLDDLLDALAKVPDIRLLVCGELWGDPQVLLDSIVRRGIADRVELRLGYVADEDVADVFGECDALVLPYRSGTGSQNVLLGHQFGIPVIATSVAGFEKQIVDGETGFVSPPEDPAALAESIRKLYANKKLAEMWRVVAQQSTPSTPWRSYLSTLLGLPLDFDRRSDEE
jgi:glycosyltransferase involved in cell wall biosynthesis